VAVITGRRSHALERRCRELGIAALYEAVEDKAAVLTELCVERALPTEAVACMGDDLPDIPMMRRAGVCFAPSDAHETVRAVAHRVTQAPGGLGAVREVCELILHGQGRWEAALGRFFRNAP
jgi:3-deoxy-D-manno-octulosonate 8-phosphate phosphatase (KDO 8-P phosphatase)